MKLSTFLFLASVKFCNRFLSYLIIVVAELYYDLFRTILGYVDEEFDIPNGNGDKLVVVTGGSTGIGLDTVIKLLNNGYNVHVLSRTKPKIPKNCDKSRLTHTKIDLMKLSGLESKIIQIFKGKRIDFLINNAGFSAEKYIEVDGIESTSALNAIAPYIITKTLAPLMSKNARIVFVASSASYCAAGIVPIKFIFDSVQNYCVSKFRILLLTIYLRKFENMNCVAMHPGIIKTNLYKKGFLFRTFGFTFNIISFLLSTSKQASDRILRAVFFPNKEIKNEMDCFFVRDEIAKMPSTVTLEKVRVCGEETERFIERLK